MVMLPVRQYYPQTDSATSHGDRMCFSSTCAMAIKYLLPDALSGVNADDTYLKKVLKYGDTTTSIAQVKACNDYGVKAGFATNGTKDKLLAELSAGYPVATGILHKGPVSAPRGGGHWMLLVGADAEYGIFHDPYGEMDNINGGYVRIGSGGEAVKYSWRNWLRRWEVEAPGTGWYMTFRSNKTSTANPTKPASINDWQGVKAVAAECGAKYPEVVAAQWALESGYGKHFSGKNNAFGLKGTGTQATTKEFHKGQWVTINTSFIDFPDLHTCIQYLVDRWYKDYKGFKGINRAVNRSECAQLLVKEKYATDPDYATKLIKLMEQND